MRYLDKSVEEIEQIIKDAEFAFNVKEYEKLNIVIEEIEYKKFKKNEPLFIKRIFNRWTESFVDEYSGEVIDIERNESLGILIDDKAYISWLLEYKKELNKYVVSHGKEETELTYIINKQLNNV